MLLLIAANFVACFGEKAGGVHCRVIADDKLYVWSNINSGANFN